MYTQAVDYKACRDCEALLELIKAPISGASLFEGKRGRRPLDLGKVDRTLYRTRISLEEVWCDIRGNKMSDFDANGGSDAVIFNAMLKLGMLVPFPTIQNTLNCGRCKCWALQGFSNSIVDRLYERSKWGEKYGFLAVKQKKYKELDLV